MKFSISCFCHPCMFMIFYATKSKKKIPVCDIDIQSHNYFFSIFMSWSHLIRDHHVLKNFSLVVTLLLFILQSSLDFFCIQKLYNWWRHVTQSSDQRQEKYTVKHSLNCYTITVTPRILLYLESFTYIGTRLGTKMWVSRYFDKTLHIKNSKKSES